LEEKSHIHTVPVYGSSLVFQNPGLFHGLSFYIYKNSAYHQDALKLNKKDLAALIKFGDGEVLIREPNPVRSGIISVVIKVKVAGTFYFVPHFTFRSVNEARMNDDDELSYFVIGILGCGRSTRQSDTVPR